MLSQQERNNVYLKIDERYVFLNRHNNMTDKPNIIKRDIGFKCYDSRKEIEESWDAITENYTEEDWAKIGKTLKAYIDERAKL